jgi:hypothetical protein
MKRVHAVTALLCLCFVSAAAEGSVMYGSEFNLRQLYSLSQTTGAGTAIGPIAPMTDIRDMASDTRPGSFALWATSQGTGQLFQMNPTTGRGTLVGPYSLPTGQEMRTLAFDTVGGRLYGTSDGTTTSAVNLYEINTTTGKATLVAPVGIAGIGGMGADALGNLYGIKEDAGQVYLIDKILGTPTLVSTLPVKYISDLAFRPEDSQLFGITHSGQEVTTPSTYVINLATNTATLLGPYGHGETGMAGLAFGPAVPEPAVGMALIGAMAFLMRRRR